ncbi:uncharacterized protein ACLA_016230 [Aspergillus clavatus NRRL 1]|uniref:C6 zinc finger domain protein n=1 Tax=Aspergillus clavatus (strain ATCC 1007 / CBS 513.65 / DSM 816 / NCTC 3887 / NRRL 1 / QM 1276 / 107) TaxID=344612 RepID=A1CBQ9_ASPCL|nr:C6 zinc finger domain protein [Aspergillus clavatus NRRL 1]EAW13177.1 C6 zinc finger domain protein [Aspergillus clavatus NRRL 1]
MFASPPTRPITISTGLLRSKSGCKTCKVRRVKCGEEKPRCVRCTSTGRKCEYEDARVSLLDNPLSISPNTVSRERRAFAFYFQHAAPFVGGGLDVEFWRTSVPQICRSEPAVWDAIIAIGALFESPEPYPDSVSVRRAGARNANQNQRDALGWYSRSVSTIRQRIETGHLDIFVGLVTCILFICIEAIQGGVEESLYLYGQGVRLILAMRAQITSGTVSATKASLLEDTIVPIFVRLGLLALPISGVPVSPLLQGTEHLTMQGFVSLKSARDAIVFLSAEAQLFQDRCIEYFRTSHASHMPQEWIHEQTALLTRLRRWHTAFTSLMDSLRAKDTLSPQQIATSALLLNYHEGIYITISTSASPSPTSTDAYEPNFQNIVDQSRIALSASMQSDGTQPPFTFEISVGLPLWFTCLRCREPRIRRTALSLFRRVPRFQGFQNCHTAAIFGERIMMLEETYAMAMNEARGIIDPTTWEPTRTPSDYQSQSPENSSDLLESEISRQFSIPDSAYAPSLSPVLPDSGTRIPTAVLIPEEARIGPIHLFRPQDGLPPGTTEKDIAKWNRRLDQTFLRFSRKERDLGSHTWRTVHEYIPIDL